MCYLLIMILPLVILFKPSKEAQYIDCFYKYPKPLRPWLGAGAQIKKQNCPQTPKTK